MVVLKQHQIFFDFLRFCIFIPGLLVILISGWKVEINGSSPLSALSHLMKRRVITTSSSHRIRVWRWKCIIGLASCCASGITESFRNAMGG